MAGTPALLPFHELCLSRCWELRPPGFIYTAPLLLSSAYYLNTVRHSHTACATLQQGQRSFQMSGRWSRPVRNAAHLRPASRLQQSWADKQKLQPLIQLAWDQPAPSCKFPVHSANQWHAERSRDGQHSHCRSTCACISGDIVSLLSSECHTLGGRGCAQT